MKTRLILLLCSIMLLAPTLLLAQDESISSLVLSFSNTENVKYTKAGKAIIWMMKSSMPKGSKIKSLSILQFEGGATSSEYISFRSQALSIFALSGAECVGNEDTDKGTMEIYVERKEDPTEYMVFMLGDDDQTIFMLMEGELPSTLEE